MHSKSFEISLSSSDTNASEAAPLFDALHQWIASATNVSGKLSSSVKYKVSKRASCCTDLFRKA